MSGSELWIRERPPREVGAGPLVVLVHGSMDRHTSFTRMASVLGEATVVTYDRRGYAGSRAVLPPASSVDDHVEDLATVLAGRPAFVFGHSFGGDIALSLAERRPELVRSVIVYEPPLPWLEWWHDESGARYRFGLDEMDPGDAAEGFVARMIGRERYARLGARRHDEIRQDGPSFVAELKALRDDPAPFDPTRIATRVLVARGGESLERHARGASYLVERLPEGRLVVVDGAGHGAHATHPIVLAGLIREEMAVVAA